VDLHVKDVLRIGLDDNLRMIEETIAHLVQHGRRVIYDAEHFFDGYAADAAYALETLRAAQRGGAEVLVLCDTNGGSLPWQIERVVAEVGRALRHPSGSTPTTTPAARWPTAWRPCAPAPATSRGRSTGSESGAATRTSAWSSRTWS
jgi:hypothetical protein